MLLSQFDFIEVHFEHLDCKRVWAFSAGHTSRNSVKIFHSKKTWCGCFGFTFWIDAHSDYDKFYPGMMAHIKFGMTFVLISSEAFEKIIFLKRVPKFFSTLLLNFDIQKILNLSAPIWMMNFYIMSTSTMRTDLKTDLNEVWSSHEKLKTKPFKMSN